jgi:hypothetical protein
LSKTRGNFAQGSQIDGVATIACHPNGGEADLLRPMH